MKELLVAGFHCHNHSLNAGYDQIVKYLNADYADANVFYGADSDFGTLNKKINLLIFELSLLIQSNKYKLIHYLYPELHLLFSMPESKIKKIGTIHLPLDLTFRHKTNFLNGGDLRAYLKSYSFRKFHGVIALSNDHIDEIKFHLKSAEVKFIPHGVNDHSQYFKNKSSEEDNFNIVTIGSNYRDLVLYLNIVKLANERKKCWKFHYIGANRDIKMKLAKFSNVITYPFLEEAQYLEIISTCDLHFLPLTFATANNALLESHSLGIPSLVSNLKSIKDYSLSTTSFFFEEEDAFNIIDKLSLLKTIEITKLRKQTLLEVEKFHWKNIANQTIDFYKQILDN